MIKITMVFYFNILKRNSFLCWQSWIFSIITPVFSVTWSFRNNSKMLIWYYYQCWKQLII